VVVEEVAVSASVRFLKVCAGWPVHPFLVAAFFVLSLFASVETKLLPMHVMNALVGSQLLSLLILVGAWLLQQNRDKAAITATVTLFWCILFRPFCTLFMPWMNFFDKHDWLVVLTYVVVLGGILVAIDRAANHPKFALSYPSFTVCMNVLSLLLFCSVAAPLAINECNEKQTRSMMVAAFKGQFEKIKLDGTKARPDVYYIILDQFAADDSLKQFFHYSPDRFSAFLRKRDFYLPKKPMSNYDNTYQSLSSSLNMSYLDPIPRALGTGNEDLSINIALMQDSAVVQLFRQIGYKIVNVSASDLEDSYWPDADRNIGAEGPNEFDMQLVMMTPWSIVEHYVPVLHEAYARRRLTPFARTKEILDVDGPKFVYIHEMMPHSPYLFDEKGKRLSPRFGLGRFNYSPEIYLGQLKFVENETMDLIAQIQDRSAQKPIIILQSDHGPDFQFGVPNQSGMMQWYANERLRILNAYCFPGMEKTSLYASISPVNSFRALFHDYFKAGLPFLTDRAQIDRDFMSGKGYRLTDVTNNLHFAD